LIGERFGQREQQFLNRCQIIGGEFLEIGDDDARAARACCNPRASRLVLPTWRAPLTSTMLSCRAMAAWNSSSVARAM
jgi:hypothetical protein